MWVTILIKDDSVWLERLRLTKHGQWVMRKNKKGKKKQRWKTLNFSPPEIRPTHCFRDFSRRYKATWRTPSSTSTRARVSRSSSTWRWAPSWPRRPARATACLTRTPRASRWPPCPSSGTAACPPWATAATPTAPSPCSPWPVRTAR